MSVQVKGSGTIGGLDEGLVISGIVTSSTQVNVGSNIKLGNAGVVTATSFVGSGANLTSLPSQLTLSNNADNRVITGGSGTNLNGESNLTFDGTSLVIGGGSAANVLDLGSATLNKGISWGGASYNYTNIWAEYGSGSLWLGAGLKSKTTNSGFFSSYGGSFARSAIELESFSGGGIKFFTSAAQTVATDGIITVDERLRITSSGEMGVNTTAPVEKLGISGNMRFVNPNGTTSRITALPSGTYSTGTSGGSAICFQRTADGGGGSDEIFFETHWQGNRHGESCRINKYGNLKFPSGQGIDFSATSDASGMSSELLDDYEEGSWTPTILGWDTFTHYSGSSYYAGWYVKVGGMVHCGWKIYYQNLSTPSSNAHIRISGLPYAAKTISAGPVCHVRFDIPDFSFSGYPVPYLSGNNTQIHFYKQVNGSNNITAINATGNYSNNWTMGTATYATN